MCIYPQPLGECKSLKNNMKYHCQIYGQGINEAIRDNSHEKRISRRGDALLR